MARFQVQHFDDACAIIILGNPKNPEPSTATIKFPGGHVEVSRCSDGDYWAHLAINRGDFGESIGSNEEIRVKLVDSRVDFDLERSREHGILPVPDADKVEHIAMRVRQVSSGTVQDH